MVLNRAIHRGRAIPRVEVYPSPPLQNSLPMATATACYEVEGAPTKTAARDVLTEWFVYGRPRAMAVRLLWGTDLVQR